MTYLEFCKPKLFLSMLAWMICSNSCLWNEPDLFLRSFVASDFLEVVDSFCKLMEWGFLYNRCLVFWHLENVSSRWHSPSSSLVMYVTWLNASDESSDTLSINSCSQQWCCGNVVAVVVVVVVDDDWRFFSFLHLLFLFSFIVTFKSLLIRDVVSSVFLSLFSLITVALTCFLWSGDTVNLTLIVLLP